MTPAADHHPKACSHSSAGHCPNLLPRQITIYCWSTNRPAVDRRLHCGDIGLAPLTGTRFVVPPFFGGTRCGAPCHALHVVVLIRHPAGDRRAPLRPRLENPLLRGADPSSRL